MAKKKVFKPRGVRVETGVHGLDSLIEGGLVPKSCTLVSGGPGAGKTLFSSQFLYHGALERKEPGVLLSLEQRPEDIIADMQDLGLDPEPLIKKKLLDIVYVNPTRFVDTKQVVEDSVDRILKESVQKIKAKRVVVDSIAAFELYLKHEYEIRKKVYDITNTLKDLGTTSIVTTEIPESAHWYSRFGVEEFVCDGVIVLNYLEFQGGNFRSLFVRKMRRTNQSGDIHPFDIERGKGIFIKEAEERFEKYVLAKTRGRA